MATDPFLEEVAHACRRLFPSPSSVLVAVSGGADSSALFHALAQLREKVGIGRLAIAHVNHGLRGAESDGDEAFVRELAARAGVAAHVTRLRGMSAESPGMEAWARDERYRFFLDVKRKEGFDCVATAHTADDQAETLIMRLWRGAGIRGLAGILERREDGVVRPLLSVTRERVEGWLGNQGLTFRHDSSNDSDFLRRNWVRHRLLPRLLSADPKVSDLLVECARNFAAINEMLRPAADSWVTKNVIRDDDSGLSVRRQGLQTRFMASYALVGLLEERGCCIARGHVESVLRCVDRGRGKVLLPGGWRCSVRGEEVWFGKDSGQHGDEVPKVRVDLAVPGTTACPGEGREIVAEFADVRGDTQPFDPRNLSVLLDADAVSGPLCYRSWDAADTFQPLGSPDTRHVGTFLKNQGIPAHERREVCVVSLRSGPIVWIPGVQIGHDFRLTAHSRRTLKLVIRRS